MINRIARKVKAALNPLALKKKESVDFFVDNYLHRDKREVFDRLLDYWKEYRFWDELIEITGADAPGFSEKKILDVGCGYTSILNLLPPCEKHGIDIIVDGLRAAGFDLAEDVGWIDGAAENIPFDNGYFDIVLCTNGLDHYDDQPRALAEIARVLKPGGIFLLTIDVFQEDVGQRGIQHPHSYTEKDLLDRLSDFEIFFNKKSPIGAQFFRYLEGGIKNTDSHVEYVLVMKRR